MSDLIIPIRAADGPLVAQVLSMVEAVGDLGVPVRLADGRLALVKVEPCSAVGDNCIPVLLADGTLTLVRIVSEEPPPPPPTPQLCPPPGGCSICPNKAPMTALGTVTISGASGTCFGWPCSNANKSVILRQGFSACQFTAGDASVSVGIGCNAVTGYWRVDVTLGGTCGTYSKTPAEIVCAGGTISGTVVVTPQNPGSWSPDNCAPVSLTVVVSGS